MTEDVNMNHQDRSDTQRKTVLIVDDEPFNLTVLRNALEHEYDILFAKTGEQALKRVISAMPPNLILLDIMMPGMDGYQVLKKLQNDPETAAIPVIFVTAMGADINEAEGLRLGAVDYITKPIVPIIVQARVKTHLALQDSLAKTHAQNLQLAQLNSTLAEKNAALLASNQIKNTFLGIAAHDLRNPLTSLIGMSELLVDVPLKETVKQEFYTGIKRASEHMLSMVNDLLDVSAIESGSFNLRPTTSPLHTLLQDRVRLATFTAQSKDIALHYDDRVEISLTMDVNRITQVIDNLLTNAIKFSSPGRSVQIGVEVVQDRVAFFVADQGPGISEKDQQRLFGHFQRLSNQPTAGERSTGLGLAIVHKVVVAHGGEITVESTLGVGSRFTVSLPR